MRLIDADELARLVKKSLDTPGYGDYYSGYDAALNTVLEYIADAPTVPAYGQWVSVKDRLPEEQKEVLIYLPEYDSVEMASLFTIPSMNLREWVQNEDAYMLDEVSYWMPLPEPPDKRYKCRYADESERCDGLGYRGVRRPAAGDGGQLPPVRGEQDVL